MRLCKIRLELARDHDFPEGSSERGYEFTAPLSADGRILSRRGTSCGTAAGCAASGAMQTDEIGHLVRKPGGNWAFHYDLLGDPEDEETGYRFGDHRFRAGRVRLDQGA